ncbi:MAG: acyl-CoA thioesterase/BAAT N-terminal domain-containing protein, partial [Gammaproteobacteria bacterium]|nr:acyl-CoA thioesterase/BAAT N-terminal domain-containing protein [Gammaproteobacteria bacterium]
MARSGMIILLLIAAAVIILCLLPTPNRGRLVVANANTPAAGRADCLAAPAEFSEPAVIAATPPAELWHHWRYGPAIALNVTPEKALVDQPLAIRVSGLKPGEPVTLRASLQDYKHRSWSAEATYHADDRGSVDVDRQAPDYGSYAGVHAMGLVWSMLPQHLKNPREVLFGTPLQATDLPLKIEALAGQRILARVTVTRYLRAPGVIKTRVSAQGLAGVLYTPAAPGPHPAIVVLGGSEGGWTSSSPLAALLAAHGYVALALAYFQGFQPLDPRLARLPRRLMDIPLEYFATAADWLRRQPGVNPRRVAVIGWSKGAEAALVTAATFPKEFQAVLALMPSSVVWSGIPNGPGPISSSWTVHGKPL